MALAGQRSSLHLAPGTCSAWRPSVPVSIRSHFALPRPAGTQLRALRNPQRVLRAARVATMAVAATAPPKEESLGTASNVWDVTFRVHGTVANPPLVIQLKDSDTGALSEAIDVSNWDTKTWDRSNTGNGPGTYLIGQLPLGDVKTPGAALIQYVSPEPKDKEAAAKQLARVYVMDVTLKAGGEEVVISAHSFCNAVHTQLYGPRIFFAANALLPHQTPDALQPDRQLDLSIIQGVDEVGKKIANDPRQPADRIEAYATYNDLGVYEKNPRPVLGDPSIDGFSYPRRVATNRKLNPDNKTESPPEGKDRWVPADDDFDDAKSVSFNSSLKYAAIPLIVEQLKTAARRLGGVGFFAGIWGAIVAAFLAVFSFGRNLTAGAASGVIGGFWDSFPDLVDIYDDTEDSQLAMGARMGGGGIGGDKLSDDQKDRQTYDAVMGLNVEERVILLRRAGISEAEFESPEKVVDPAKWHSLRASVNDKLRFNEPLVYSGHHTPRQESDGDADHRHNAWSTDEEFGRQYVAGPNPFTVAALSALPANSALNDSIPLIDSFLEGHSLKDLIADVAAGKPPRMYIVDYEDPLTEYASLVNKEKENRCLYAGRALLYKRNDDHLVPVAIELHAPATPQSERTVYTSKDPPQVWLLAKAAFNTIDSGIHQLISHWLRTHACCEPYIIATDRNLSQLHPVYKLLQPHLQYTYRINADARSVLIAADKIVEMVFTPGGQSMQLSAAVYADWKFKEQAFPVDVVKRGLAKKGADGRVDIISGDHPWAEDGKLIWESLEAYVHDYLKVYYKDDGAVKNDPELTAWWDEIRNKGHPDAQPDGWPPLNGVDDLTLILTTITWTTSAHHAAVNFGQADYASFPLNRSSLMRKPMPTPGSTAYNNLTNPAKFEKEFLRYLVNPLPASIVIAVMEILSTHSENEHYITDESQNYIYDEAAARVHTKFLDNLKAVEEEINKRNTSGKSRARTPADGGLPYQLLIPSGVYPDGKRVANTPGRGIPYSISI